MTSAKEAVEQFLDQAEHVEPLVNSLCTTSPDLAVTARSLDAESADGRLRGPLHGQIVVVKDNIDTADMLTTAGSLALTGHPPAVDAPLVTRLRDAGMVIAAKSNLSEWANIRDPGSTSGWSAYGGLTRNPYGLNRSAGGSSAGSGAAVAAGLTRLAVGTETDGSITCPAAFNGCVGIKPTVGLLPTQGIVPISASQDTAGPMAASVGEAAALLSVLADNGVDYAEHAMAGGLRGKRIGIPRQVYWGYSALADEAAERALSVLSAEGAELVDPTDLESMIGYGWEDELLVLLAELKTGLADYLPTRGRDGPQSLADVVEFNRERADEELRWFGQSFFELALESPGLDSEKYASARMRCLDHGRKGIDKLMAEHQLDAMVSPSYAPAIPIDLVNPEHDFGSCTQPTAMAGYPLVTVPVSSAQGLPVAVSFWGTAGAETTLIEIAAGFEAARDAKLGPLPEPTFPSFV
jgi:amidase